MRAKNRIALCPSKEERLRTVINRKKASKSQQDASKRVWLVPYSLLNVLFSQILSVMTADVSTILDTNERYNPKHLPLLEANLTQQCADGTFNLDSNLALLKL